MQETKERPALAAGLFRALLYVLAAGMLLLSLAPGARAAEVKEPRQVIPLGQAVGIKLFAQGVLVVGLSDIDTQRGLASPAKAAGLKEGDVITHINDEQVDSIEEVQAILEDLDGAQMELSVLRDQKSLEVTTSAVQCSADGAYKLGAWIRDSMAGIGTLTFVDPATGLFGTLGHGINDVDTAVLMGLREGAITPASIAGVVKGVDGRPGELRGAFTSPKDLGTLYANTRQGVFGHMTAADFSQLPTVPVADPGQVKPGKATILANVEGTDIREYEVEILKVYHDADDCRDLMLKVTDKELLEKTGGIVQGMSGSPILQNGRLVGAVTHVLIDHADRGYGIFATHMLEAAEAAG